MDLPLNFIEKAKEIVFTIGFTTTLVGGHMVGSYLLLDLKYPVLNYYGYTVLGIIALNAITFALCIALQFTKIDNKHEVMRIAFGLLLNIPMAILYLIILFSYET